MTVKVLYHWPPARPHLRVFGVWRPVRPQDGQPETDECPADKNCPTGKVENGSIEKIGKQQNDRTGVDII
jgi:hypothetical protein